MDFAIYGLGREPEMCSDETTHTGGRTGVWPGEVHRVLLCRSPRVLDNLYGQPPSTASTRQMFHGASFKNTRFLERFGIALAPL